MACAPVEARRPLWPRSTLVVAEIAIALVLLTTAGALLRSYQRMLAVDPGYRADHVLVAGYQLPLDQYPTDASVNAFHRAVLERLSHKPGVVAAAFTNILPASDSAGMSASRSKRIRSNPEAEVRVLRHYRRRLFRSPEFPCSRNACSPRKTEPMRPSSSS